MNKLSKQAINDLKESEKQRKEDKTLSHKEIKENLNLDCIKRD